MEIQITGTMLSAGYSAFADRLPLVAEMAEQQDVMDAIRAMYSAMIEMARNPPSGRAGGTFE